VECNLCAACCQHTHLCNREHRDEAGDLILAMSLPPCVNCKSPQVRGSGPKRPLVAKKRLRRSKRLAGKAAAVQ
jgi:hypothetical protein